MEEENSTPKSPESAGGSGQKEQSASAEPAEVKSTEESPAPSKDARMWAMFCHLGGLAGFVFPFGNIILPLIFWQVKKEEFPFLLAAVVIVDIVFLLIAAVKANNGQSYRYPLCIRFVK
jgi:uncharacterized Tic20 family protein